MARDAANRRELCVLLSVLAAAVLSGVRLVLRFDFQEQGTGFYATNSILLNIFYVLYLIFLAALALLAFGERHEARGAPALGRPGGGVCALLGAALLWEGVWEGFLGHTAAPRRGADLFLSWAVLAFSLAAGGVLLVLAAELWRGRPLRSAATGALALPVLHRCFFLLESFTRSAAQAPTPEGTLAVLLPVFGTLFFVALARILTTRQSAVQRQSVGQPQSAGQPQNTGQCLFQFAAGAYVVTWAALAVPELLSAASGRGTLAPGALARTVQEAATALCCLVLSRRTARER